MVQSGQYYPSVAWVVLRAEALWHSMVNPSTVTLDDVHCVFFMAAARGYRARYIDDFPNDADVNVECSESALRRSSARIPAHRLGKDPILISDDET